MFRLDGGRPNDERGFLHKRIIGGVKGFIGGGGSFSAAAAGFLKSPSRPTIERSLTARPSVLGEAGKLLGRQLKFGNGAERAFPATALVTRAQTAVTRALTNGGGECEPPLVPDPKGRGFCVFPESPVGREAGLGGRNGRAPVGDAVLGQFGAALQPGIMTIERSVCLRGMQLGSDGLCYNKGAISNRQRMWPRGTRPLLTGGDMRAIRIAARAGAKMERTTKRLRSLGVMKALPKPRTLAAHPPHPALGPK